MIKIGIMKKGDKIISVTSEFIAVKRKDGEVDLVPLIKGAAGWRVDAENIITIGYGSNTVTVEDESGVKVTNF